LGGEVGNGRAGGSAEDPRYGRVGEQGPGGKREVGGSTSERRRAAKAENFDTTTKYGVERKFATATTTRVQLRKSDTENRYGHQRRKIATKNRDGFQRRKIVTENRDGFERRKIVMKIATVSSDVNRYEKSLRFSAT